MVAAFQLAGLGMVVLASISFALLLEWLSLWGLMKLMPATRTVAPAVSMQVPPVAATPQRVVPIHARLRLRPAGR